MEKVREGWRRLEEVRGSRRKLEKVWNRGLENGRESQRKCENKCEKV